MRNVKGLTLVEVLVSLAVLAFISLSVMSMLSSSLHLDKLAQERSVATSLASERIGQISAMPYQKSTDYAEYALPEEASAAGPPPTLTTDYEQIPGYPDFRRVVELRYETPVSGMLTVRATVSWIHVGHEEREHTMITFLHPGLE